MMRTYFVISLFPTSVVKMLFTFVICHLIFCVNFSLEAKLGDGRLHHHSKDNAVDDLKQEMKNSQNETNELNNFIKKSQLAELIRLKNQNMVKNYIEEFENHYAIYFVPDWTQVNTTDSSARQNICIRRQKWEYILNKANDTFFVKSLKSELKKSNLSRATFCNEIAESYFALSDISILFDTGFNSKERGKGSQTGGDPLQNRSILAFMRTVSNIGLNLGESKETVNHARSLYVELVNVDSYKFRDIEKLKRDYEDRIKRLKAAYRDKVQFAQHDQCVSSEIDSRNY